MWGLGQRLPRDGSLQASDLPVSPMVAPCSLQLPWVPLASWGLCGHPRLSHTAPASLFHFTLQCLPFLDRPTQVPPGGISFPLEASCLPQHTWPIGLPERPPGLEAF